jgi:hypothetical protein
MNSPIERVESLMPDIALLDSSVYQDMCWCMNCGGERVFLSVYEFEGGRVGCCMGCGEQRIAPFTRTTSEEA